MNTNIVMAVIDLFQILPKFREVTRRLKTILQKSYKNKIISHTIFVVDNKDKLYTEPDYSN